MQGLRRRAGRGGENGRADHRAVLAEHSRGDLGEEREHFAVGGGIPAQDALDAEAVGLCVAKLLQAVDVDALDIAYEPR